MTIQIKKQIRARVSDVIRYIVSDGFYFQTGNPCVFHIPGAINGRITFAERNHTRTPVTIATISGYDVDRENIATELVECVEGRC